jgi:hypothetical protein
MVTAARTTLGSRRKRAQTLAEKSDKHILYEKAVQDADAEIEFIEATYSDLRGRSLRTLREDFCGTASVATTWVRRHRGNHALGVDLDPEVLAWGQAHHVARLTAGERDRLRLVEGNVLSVHSPNQDAVLAMNFSYWIFKQRAQLRSYFKTVLGHLNSEGVFFLDCYGGYDAFRVLRERRRLGNFTYIWDQASYNPVTGDYRCHIHFRFADGSKLERAFTYDWRLWTLPEVREILAEAGFSRTLVYWQGWDEDEEDGDGDFKPIEEAEPDAGWIAYVVALK